MRVRTMLFGLGAALGVALAACGGSSSPGSPSPSPGGDGSTTITIGANGVVSPKTITVRQGGQVTFVNSDTRSHQVASDPHPEHTDCPPINDVGFLSPGQSRNTGNFTAVRTCGFHDHNEPGNANLQGRITVQ